LRVRKNREKRVKKGEKPKNGLGDIFEVCKKNRQASPFLGFRAIKNPTKIGWGWVIGGGVATRNKPRLLCYCM
jgi:hypothetical protein